MGYHGERLLSARNRGIGVGGFCCRDSGLALKFQNRCTVPEMPGG